MDCVEDETLDFAIKNEQSFQNKSVITARITLNQPVAGPLSAQALAPKNVGVLTTITSISPQCAFLVVAGNNPNKLRFFRELPKPETFLNEITQNDQIVVLENIAWPETFVYRTTAYAGKSL